MTILKVTLPKYETTLPISGKKVIYRPFVSREEKILLLAQEENNVESIIRALDQIFEECTFGVVKIDDLNKVDAEYLFIQMRNKSLGEGVEVNAICKSCKGKTHLVLNLEQIKVENKNAESTFKLSDDLWVTMKIPPIKDSLALDKDDEDAVIACSLDTITQGESSYNASEYSIEERKEFVDSLARYQKVKLKKFFDEFPVLTYDVDFKCSHCLEENHVHVEGIEHFFG